MKTQNQQALLGQAEIAMEGKSLHEFAREAVHGLVRADAARFVLAVIAEEVRQLCGRPHERKGGGNLAYRGGSEPGSVVVNGQREEIRRPRVRDAQGEVRLTTYDALHGYAGLGEFVSQMMLAGLSTRGFERTLTEHQAALGLSKSAASREFIEGSRAALNEINQRRFPDRVFWALLVDGLHVCGEALVVALGVDMQGNKYFLGISQGSTENADVVKALLASLGERGIRFTDRVLAVIDGAKALRRALLDHFGDSRVAIQRCFIHKKRNVAARLAKQHVPEAMVRISTSFNCNDYKTASAEMEKTVAWLETINHNAAESLSEGLPDLLTLHRIGMAPKLRKSFYTTNAIDSAFSAPRAGTNRVKRWRKDSDMIKRWFASHLLDQEKRFRRVNAPQEIPHFLEKFSSLRAEVVDGREAA